MKKFLMHLYVAICLFRLGYFFSKLTNDHESWGFYRINFEREGTTIYALTDIDFNNDFVHMHGTQFDLDKCGQTIHRWDRNAS